MIIIKCSRKYETLHSLKYYLNIVKLTVKGLMRKIILITVVWLEEIFQALFVELYFVSIS